MKSALQPDAWDLAVAGPPRFDELDEHADSEGAAQRRLDRLRPHPRGRYRAEIPVTVALRPTITLNSRMARSGAR